MRCLALFAALLCAADLSAADKLPTAPKDIKVAIVDGDGYAKLLKGLKGNVILVDYWATWCIPCRKQFGHTVKLAKDNARKGLAVVTVSIDIEEKKAAVLKWLKKKDARTHNVMSKFGVSDKTAEAFEFRGDVPFYKLYDRSGKLRYQFGPEHKDLKNGQPIENIDKRVAELLAEK